jgi:hypothetical protein
MISGKAVAGRHHPGLSAVRPENDRPALAAQADKSSRGFLFF